MSGKVMLDVYTLDGTNQAYEVDLEMTIDQLIRRIIISHRGLIEKKDFDPKKADLVNTRLIYNNKSLDHGKSLEKYTEFQYKAKGSYKMHIIPKGGKIDPKMEDQSPTTEYLKSSPISIKYGSLSHRNNSNSRSYPGSNSGNSFLDNQINRID